MTNEAASLSPEQIVEMFPPIAQSMAEAARRAGVSPTDMQSRIWNQGVHSG